MKQASKQVCFPPYDLGADPLLPRESCPLEIERTLRHLGARGHRERLDGTVWAGKTGVEEVEAGGARGKDPGSHSGQAGYQTLRSGLVTKTYDFYEFAVA